VARALLTPLARTDLDELARYIAQEARSRDVARRFLRVIDTKCATYSAHPELGELRPDLSAEVRCFSIGSYTVFYRALAKGIEVLRVLHGSRDIPVVWKKP